MTWRLWLQAVVPLVLIPLTACEFTRTLGLPADTGLVENTSIGRGRTLAVQVPFTDERASRDNCGKVANFRLECDQEPGLWLSELLVQELLDRGFTVVTDEAQPIAGRLSIDGALYQLYVRHENRGLAVTTVAEITVQLVARSGGGKERRQSFSAQEDSGNEYWRLSALDWHRSLLRALQRVIPDMAQKIEAWERTKDQ